MRSRDSFEDRPTSHIHSDNLSADHQGDTIKSTYQAKFPLDFLHSHLPQWCSSRPSHTPKSLTLEYMLRALKASAESYLETSAPLCAVEIVFPFPITASLLSALRSAIHSLSLSVPLSVTPPAGLLTAQWKGLGEARDDYYFNTANRIAHERDIPDEDEAQLILTVDYTDAALTALLIFEECNIFEYRRALHSTELGAAQVTNHYDETYHSSPRALNLPDEEIDITETSQREEALASAFRNITHLPLNDGGNGEEVRWISHVILLGERACHPMMSAVLREVLRERYAHYAGIGGTSPVDIGNACNERKEKEMLFRAARAAARDSWDRMNFDESRTGRVL